MKARSITLKQLGTRCWLPHRFCGGRCFRVLQCGIPEKTTCEAVPAERTYIEDHKNKVVADATRRADEQLKKLDGGQT